MKIKITLQSLEEMFLVFEQIMELENKLGIYVPIKKLKRAVKKLKRKKKIGEKKVDSIIQRLIALGIIYIPRGGFVLRIANDKRHFEILKIEKSLKR